MRVTTKATYLGYVLFGVGISTMARPNAEFRLPFMEYGAASITMQTIVGLIILCIGCLLLASHHPGRG